MIYDYIDIDYCEAPHGRAPAVATGLKTVRPDKIVFTYQGDGDLASIGMGEIVHAANRGQNITVVCWALPQTESTKKKMRTQTEQPCKEWALNRTFGEEFNRYLAAQIESWFESQGVPAVAPMARPDFSWGRSEKYGLASNWSERHAAHIAGLGTFGLCDGLISKLGKAVRYGSVIAAVPLKPSARDYTTYREYCRADRGCTGCIDRCPAGAITREGGHDKDKCVAYQKEHVVPYAQQAYGFEGTYGCGLCQTNVPCESRCPV